MGSKTSLSLPRLAPAPILGCAILLLVAGFSAVLRAADVPPAAAGTITAVIPKDYIERGKSVEEAQKGAQVFWKDIIRTEARGRVRIGLTDGSILNIGSQTRIQIVRQDEGSQQSELTLLYGKVRATVVKRTRDGGSFQVRSAQAVAGVIGTEEYIDATPTATVVLALHGAVAVRSSNAAIEGAVILEPGQLTVVLDNQPPQPPRHATVEELQSAFEATAPAPVVTLEPNRGLAGTGVEAMIRGENLAGARAVAFAQPGLSAEILPGETADSVPVRIQVAENVAPGAYSFTVETPAGNRAGTFVVYSRESSVVGTGLPGFSLAVAPANTAEGPLLLARGGQLEVSVTLLPEKGFRGTASLAVGPLPPGLSVEPSSAVLSNLGEEGAAPASATLHISATGNTPEGLVSVPLTAVFGSLLPRSALIHLQVGGIVPKGFAIGVAPLTSASDPAELPLGGSVEFEVTLIPDPEFDGVVALSVGPLPPRITVQPTSARLSRDPAEAAPPPVTVTVEATSQARVGMIEIRLLVAAEGFEPRSIPVFLNIVPPPPPVPSLQTELFYSPTEPPVLLQGSTVQAAQGARLRLNASESTAAPGFDLVAYRWEVLGTSVRGQGSVFELDTWTLNPGTHRLLLTVQDTRGQTASTELTLELRALPDPAVVVDACLRAGTESLQLSQFMGCFDEQRFNGYPKLEEETRNFFERLSSARVYYVIANRQDVRGAEATAIFQINPFQITFTTKSEPGLVQQRTDDITLRTYLVRLENREEWKIIDFASSSRAALLLSDFNLLTTLATGLTLTGSDPLPVLAGGRSTPITINIESLSGFTGQVQVSLEGLPAGVRGSPEPASVTAGSAAQLTFSADAGAKPADYPITVVGQVGQLRRTRSLLLRVTDFALTAGSAPALTAGGDAASVTVGVESKNHFAGTVALSAGPLPAGFRADFASDALTVEPGAAEAETTLVLRVDLNTAAGSFDLTLSGTVEGVQRTQVLRVTVLNSAPQLGDISNLSVAEGEQAEIGITATDANGDPVALRLVNPPAWAGLSGTLITLRPDFEVVSRLEGQKDFPLTVSATDSLGAATQKTFTATVLHTNRPPLLTPIPDQEIAENTVRVLSLTVQDQDGDPVTLELVNAPSWASFLEGVQLAPDFDVVPGDQAAAVFRMGVRATDDRGASDVKEFNVTVLNANRPPFVAALPAVVLAEGESAEVTVVASDSDGGPVALRLVAPPAWAGLDGTVITLAPDFDVVSRLEGSKEFLLTVEASDGSLTAQATLEITVLHTNRAPAWSAIGDLVVLEGTTETLTVSASDPDGDLLTLGLVSAPSFVTLTDNSDGSGVLTLSPGFAAAASYTVTVQASDGVLAAETSFVVTVEEDEEDDPGEPPTANFSLRIRNQTGGENSPSNPLEVTLDRAHFFSVRVRRGHHLRVGEVQLELQDSTSLGLILQCVAWAPQSQCRGNSATVNLTHRRTAYIHFFLQATAQATPGPAQLSLQASSSEGSVDATVYLMIEGRTEGHDQEGWANSVTAPAASVPTSTSAAADLSVSVHDVTASLRPGETLNIRVPVHNRGEVEAEGASLVLRIPAWSVEAREALSLAARESAVVEFTLDIPPNATLADVGVELEVRTGNRLADPRPENNRVIVRNLFAEPTRGGQRDRAVLELDAGACVGLRLDDGRVAECDGLNDLELQSDANGSLRLMAEAIGALGPIALNRSVESASSLSAQAALEAGTAYVVVRGSLRVRVRVVRVQMVGAVPLRSPHGLPRPLDVPTVNDPHRLPTGSYKRDPSGLKPRVVVELEWERLSP